MERYIMKGLFSENRIPGDPSGLRTEPSYQHPPKPATLLHQHVSLAHTLVMVFASIMTVCFVLTFMIGAVRLEHQFYALGQACAIAADIAIKAATPLQDVPYAKLRDRLLEEGMIIDADLVGIPEMPRADK